MTSCEHDITWVFWHHDIMWTLWHHYIVWALWHHEIMWILWHPDIMWTLWQHDIMGTLWHHDIMWILWHHDIMTSWGHCDILTSWSAPLIARRGLWTLWGKMARLPLLSAMVLTLGRSAFWPGLEGSVHYVNIHIHCIKGGRWKCHIIYKGQDCFSPFLSMQQTNRCQLTAVAWYACDEAIKVTWHLVVWCHSVNNYISFALCI